MINRNLINLLVLFTIVISTEVLSQQYGSWEIIDSMNVPRYWFGTTILTNSEVIVSGSDSETLLNSTEIYNVTNDSWELTSTMLRGRAAHHLFKLNNGEVIAVGGFLTRSCEVFNSSSNSWRYTDSLKTMKYFWDTATLLNDGRILVAGGYYFDRSTLQNIYYKTCEIFDPITETWSFTDSLAVGRSSHTATLLNNGRVLITGGQNNTGDINSCEIYNPVTNEWAVVNSLLHARSFHSAVLLSDGRVLVSGGITPDSTLGTKYCEIYDPITDSWSEAGEMTFPRTGHKTLLLFDSTVLITGGTFEPEIWEIYDPKTLSVIYYDTLPVVVFEPEIEMFPDGRIISMGGYTFDGMLVENSNLCLMYTPNVTDVTEESLFVSSYSLSQNYPNPFNPATNINYSIKESGFVTLKVYDILGKQVAVLVNENKPAGNYTVEFNAANLPSGVYIYKLTAGKFTAVKKLVLIK